jgi:hypothetical protein
MKHPAYITREPSDLPEYPFLLVYAFHFLPLSARHHFYSIYVTTRYRLVGVEGSGVNPKT